MKTVGIGIPEISFEWGVTTPKTDFHFVYYCLLLFIKNYVEMFKCIISEGIFSFQFFFARAQDFCTVLQVCNLHKFMNNAFYRRSCTSKETLFEGKLMVTPHDHF